MQDSKKQTHNAEVTQQKRQKDAQQMGQHTTAPMRLFPELQQKDNHYDEMIQQNKQTNYLQNNNACPLTQDAQYLLIEDNEQSETEPVQNPMLDPPNFQNQHHTTGTSKRSKSI